jgi:hypothetical protein
MTVPTTPAHPAFRQVEKHFKNRATWALPALRDLPRELCHPVLDLSRPEAEADDPVYCAGWWAESFAAPSQQRARKGAGTGAGRVRPRGSRPELVPDARPVKLSDGRVGFVVAEGGFP